MSGQSSKFPASIYSNTVLTHIFADAKRLFLPAMLQIDAAHVVMLAEQKIIHSDVASACLRALDALNVEEILATPYDGTVEDLFFLVEKKLASLCGEENAGRIHTARSRNDLDMTMYRIVLRSRLLQALEASQALRARILALANEHAEALIPAYTHNQPAQPTTLGHYLMAFIEILERDSQRLHAAFLRVNRNPLGACAVTTTGFPIQRERTAELLGFDGLQTNSYGAIAAVDYIAESCSALATAMLSLGRFAQDMLLWSTSEFGYLRLSEGYVQISSIMPQKRNPVPLEHVRILASRAMTQSQAVLQSLHNTPFADMNDSEDPLQPLIDISFNDGIRAMQLLEGALSEASFNTARMKERAGQDFLTVTELADTLVRSTGISFHQAHGFVSAAVKAMGGTFDRERMIGLITGALEEHSISVPDESLLRKALDPAYFIAVRNIPGGPALEALTPELRRAETQLDRDRAQTAEQRSRLEHAEAALRLAVKALTA